MLELPDLEAVNTPEDRFHAASNQVGPAMSDAVAAPRWDRTRVLFEIIEGGQIHDCAISREALQDISDRRYAKPAELLVCFEKVRPRLEAVARAKLRNRSEAIEGLVTIWSGDLDEPLPPE